MDNKMNCPADVLWVSKTLYKERTFVKPHAHDIYYHLICVCSGYCDVRVCGEEFRLTPGKIMLAPPGAVHEICVIEDEKTVEFNEIKFVVHSQQMDSALRKLDWVWGGEECDISLCNEIVKQGPLQRGNLGMDILRTYLATLLYRLCEPILFCDVVDDVSTSFLAGINTEGFSKVTLATVEYIEKNYMNEITIEKIGEEIGYYKNYISTMVRKDLSITVNEILMLIRIQHAVELLVYSDLEIKQIYVQTGFKSVNHFTRIFKKIVGVPPAQYRNGVPDGILHLPTFKQNTMLPVFARGNAMRVNNSK